MREGGKGGTSPSSGAPRARPFATQLLFNEGPVFLRHGTMRAGMIRARKRTGRIATPARVVDPRLQARLTRLESWRENARAHAEIPASVPVGR